VVLDQHGVQHEGVSEIVQHAMEIGPMLGISLEVMGIRTALDKKHCREVSATPSKCGTKGKRELKNLECSINFEGSSRGKMKRALSVF
jgi:hypothetical protein